MLESDRCCRRKPLRQTHASCLRERCSSVKSRRNSPFLEPVPLLAASLSSRGGEAWRGERRLRKTPRNESLLPAICRVLKKCHGAPRLQDPPRPLLTKRPCVATGVALAARVAPAPARLDASRFPLDLSENSAAGAQGRRVPLAANLSPKAFSAGQALKQQSQSEALNSCNLS